MTAAETRTIRNNIRQALRSHTSIAPAKVAGLLSVGDNQGKLYELSVLAEVCKRLHQEEGYDIHLSSGTVVRFRQKGAWLDPKFPHIKLLSGGILEGELHVDLYFTTISHRRRGAIGRLPGDFHELDIAITNPNPPHHPSYTDILVAIECKHTKLEKNIIREILGYRRELAFLPNRLQETSFTRWPASEVQADPPSVQIFYCSDEAVLEYRENCAVFGIQVEWLTM